MNRRGLVQFLCEMGRGVGPENVVDIVTDVANVQQQCLENRGVKLKQIKQRRVVIVRLGHNRAEQDQITARQRLQEVRSDEN
jgi:hypothetical protein